VEHGLNLEDLYLKLQLWRPGKLVNGRVLLPSTAPFEQLARSDWSHHMLKQPYLKRVILLEKNSNRLEAQWERDRPQWLFVVRLNPSDPSLSWVNVLNLGVESRCERSNTSEQPPGTASLLRTQFLRLLTRR
jgi:hypothetical protein